LFVGLFCRIPNGHTKKYIGGALLQMKVHWYGSFANLFLFLRGYHRDTQRRGAHKEVHWWGSFANESTLVGLFCKSISIPQRIPQGHTKKRGTQRSTLVGLFCK